MNYKFKQLIYFIKWLLADIRNNISFWPIYFGSVLLSTSMSIIIGDEIGKFIMKIVIISCLLVMVYGFIVIFIVMPLKFKYAEYKQEQRDLLSTIKGQTDDDT